MPTYGWVREDAWESFLEGTDPVPNPQPMSPPRFHCFICQSIFSSLPGLQKHLASEHQIARPFFAIQGREAESETTIRTRHSPHIYAIANATSATISIDGSAATKTPIKGLPERLAHMTGEVASLILLNEAEVRAAPVASHYRIQFRIPEACELRAVEQAFQTYIMGQTLTLTTIHRLLDKCAGLGAAKDYADGICNYLTAILVKERPSDQSISTPVARYRELFTSSIQILSSYPRPLARALICTAKFAMNDFSASQVPTEVEGLDFATTFFRAPSTSKACQRNGADGKRRPAFPIDHGTAMALDICSRFMQLDRWGPIPAEECRQITESDFLDIMDRDKILAVWALTALRLGVTAAAVAPLKRLASTYPFSTWAAPSLEGIST